VETSENSLALRPDLANHEQRRRLAEMRMGLDGQIDYAKAGGFEWLEVEDAVLRSFCKGELPESGYFIYKDIRLCLTGQAEDLAKRDGMDIHAIVFKEEAKTMKVGVGHS
jgi:hypothetical protein